MLLRRGWPLCALLACSGPGPEDGGADASLDAGRDGGRDAGYDAGRDAGYDAGPNDPGWQPWVTLEACSYERASNPEGVLRVDWAPCPEHLGLDDCTAPTRAGLLASFGWFDAGTGYYRVTENGPGNLTMRILLSVDGRTLAAWRYVRRYDNAACALDMGIGDGHVAIVPGYFDGDDASRHVEQVFYGPIDQLNELDAPVATISPGVQPQHVAVSSEVVAFWTGYWAIGVDPVTGDSTRLNEALPGTPQNVQVVGARVFWEDWADLVRIAVGDMSTPASILHRADPGDVKQFHTDGVTLTWLEGFDRRPDGIYDRLELWAAPYTDDAAALAPRMVRRMELHNSAAYGGGWYVVRRSDPRGYEIIDVRDGTRRWWLAPVSQEPLYVSENEILAQGLIRFDPHELPIAD